MWLRLDEIPVFDTRVCHVPASQYNLAVLALTHLGKEVRLELPRIRSLDMVICADAWAIVDRSLNDVPILAWVGFEKSARNTLQDPVRCERRVYHGHAPVIIDKAFDAMQHVLELRLDRLRDNKQHVVLELKRPLKGGLKNKL